MTIPREVVLTVVGWALLLAGLWGETTLGGPASGSMPSAMAHATVTLTPLLFGLFIALTLGRRPKRSTCWLQAVLAIGFLGEPYAASAGLFSLGGWWGATFADPTARGLVVVWFALALVQGLRRPAEHAVRAVAQGRETDQKEQQTSGVA